MFFLSLGALCGGAWHNLIVTDKHNPSSAPPRETRQSDADRSFAHSLYNPIPSLITGIIGVISAVLPALGVGFRNWILILTVALLGLTVVIGWPELLRIPNPAASRISLSAIYVVSLIMVLTEKNFLPFLAAVGIVTVFLSEMLRSASAVRRLEQISSTYLGMLLIISVALWHFNATEDEGCGISICFAATSAIVAIISALDSRSSMALGVVNGIVSGIGFSLLLSFSPAVGLCIGLLTAGAYLLTRHSFPAIEDAVRVFEMQQQTEAEFSKTLAALLCYATPPVSVLGSISFALILWMK